MELSPSPWARASTRLGHSEAGEQVTGPREIVRRVDVHEHDLGCPPSRHLILGDREDADFAEEAGDLEATLAEAGFHRGKARLGIAGVKRLELRAGLGN